MPAEEMLSLGKTTTGFSFFCEDLTFYLQIN
jgi:hypothetical protein